MKEYLKIIAQFDRSGQKVTRDVVFETKPGLRIKRIKYIEGDIGINILILKEFLNKAAFDHTQYVNPEGCAEKISWTEGPYFDSKTKYVLFLYQQFVSDTIKEFLKRNYNLSDDDAATAYAEGLGQLNLATLAAMHGWSLEGEYEPFLENRGFISVSSSNNSINADTLLDTDSDLFKAAAFIMEKVIEVQEQDSIRLVESVRSLSGVLSRPTRELSAIEYFQRPDPNIVGANSGVEESFFEIAPDKSGIYLPTEHTLQLPPPRLSDAEQRAFIRNRTIDVIVKMARSQRMPEVGSLKIPIEDDIFRFLYDVNEHNMRLRSSPYLLEELKNNNKYYYFNVDYDIRREVVDTEEPNTSLYDALIFLEEFSAQDINPLVEYRGFTAPSFRPGAIYKSEFVVNKKKFDLFLKFSPSEVTPPTPAEETAVVVEQRSDELQSEWLTMTQVDSSVIVDVCIEDEIKREFAAEVGIRKLLSSSENEIRDEIEDITDRATEKVIRDARTRGAIEDRIVIIENPRNYSTSKAGRATSEKEILGASAEAGFRRNSSGEIEMGPDGGLLGAKVFGPRNQIDSGSSGLADAAVGTLGELLNLSARKRPAEKRVKHGEISNELGDILKDIKDVIKIFKKLQKELDEYESSPDGRTLTPAINLENEAKNLKDFGDLLKSAVEYVLEDTNNARGAADLGALDADDVWLHLSFKIDSKTKKMYLGTIKMFPSDPWGETSTNLNTKFISDGLAPRQEPEARKRGKFPDLFRPSYAAGYMINLKIMYHEATTSKPFSPLASCFAFMKPAVALGMTQKYTIPSPFLQPTIGDDDWPAFLGPIKSAADQAREQTIQFAASYQKGVAEWWTEQAKVQWSPADHLPSLSGMAGEFNQVCNLDKLYSKVLDKLNIGVLICQILKCMGLMPLSIPFDLKIILPKIPKLPVFDPMRYILNVMVKAIIRVLAQQLCKFVQTILDLLKLECKGPDISLQDQPVPDEFDGWDPQLVDLARGAMNTGLPESLYGTAAVFVEDLSHVLTPSELCSMFKGDPTSTANEIALNLLKVRYNTAVESGDVPGDAPALSDFLANNEDLSKFFAQLGVLGIADFCKTIEDVVAQVPEIDQPEDCYCVDGEALRDKLCRQGSISGALCEATLAEAQRNRDRARAAYEDLASGRMIESMTPDMMDFSDPASPLFDLPLSMKSMLATSVKAAFEPLRMDYYDDIRLYVPYLKDTVIEVQVDAQTSPGTNNVQEQDKLQAIETMRNFSFWLSALRPFDFDLGEFSKNSVETLYAVLAILNPIYKERFAVVHKDGARYLRSNLDPTEIEGVLSDVVEKVGFIDAYIDRILEVSPSPYSGEDIPPHIIAGDAEVGSGNTIDNLEHARDYWPNLKNPSRKAEAIALKGLTKVSLLLKAAANRGGVPRSYPAPFKEGMVQVFSFFNPESRTFEHLPGSQTAYNVPIIVGFDVPTIFAQTVGKHEIKGSVDVPLDVGLLETTSTQPGQIAMAYSFDDFLDNIPRLVDKLDRTDTLKAAILRQISLRMKELVQSVTQNFVNEAVTSNQSTAKQESKFLPKVKALFQKEKEIIREKTGVREIIDLAEGQEQRLGRMPTINLFAPAELDNFVELVIRNYADTADELLPIDFDDFKESAKVKMRWSFSPNENSRQVVTRLSIEQDPHFLQKPWDQRPIHLDSCLGIPRVLADDIYLAELYDSTGLLPEDASTVPNAQKLYMGIITSGSAEMFRKYDSPELNFRLHHSAVAGRNVLLESYKKTLELIFEETFDQIFDSPFIQDEAYMSEVERKLTGKAYYVKTDNENGCPVENRKFEPVSILIDWDVEIQRAIGALVNRMREPNAFRNIDFEKPSPFEEGAKDAIILLLLKVFMYEFALRAGPAMSSFVAQELIKHPYIISFISEWIVDHELQNLAFFRETPSFRRKFLQILMNLTGKSDPKEAIATILLDEIEEVGRRVDNLFDSFIADSRLAFLNRLPYGNVFSLSSISDAQIHEVGEPLSTGTKSINLNARSVGSINKQYVSFSEQDVRSDIARDNPDLEDPVKAFGRGSIIDMGAEYAKKGGFLVESYLRLKGPVARNLQRLFFEFETLKEEFQRVEDEAPLGDPPTFDEFMRQREVAVDFDRIVDSELEEEERLKDEIIVSINEFRAYLEGQILNPLLGNLSENLEDLGYASDCNLKPEFAQGYPTKFVKLDRHHTVIDSRHLDFHRDDGFEVSMHSFVNITTLNADNHRTTALLGSPVGSAGNPQHGAEARYFTSDTRYLAIPDALCPFVNTREKEDAIAATSVAADLPENAHEAMTNENLPTILVAGEKLSESHRNHTFDFDYFHRDISEEDVVAFTPEADFKDVDQSIYMSTLAAEGLLDKNLTPSFNKLMPDVRRGTHWQRFDNRETQVYLANRRYDPDSTMFSDFNEEANYRLVYDNNGREALRIAQNMYSTSEITNWAPAALADDDETRNRKLDMLRLSTNFKDTRSNDPEATIRDAYLNIGGNYELAEEDWNHFAGASQGEGGNPERWSKPPAWEHWTQYVIDVVGFAAPMVEHGESFHHPDDLPTISQELRDLLKIADGYQYWKRYLMAPDYSLNLGNHRTNQLLYGEEKTNAPRKPGAIICDALPAPPIPDYWTRSDGPCLNSDEIIKEFLTPDAHQRFLFSHKEKINLLMLDHTGLKNTSNSIAGMPQGYAGSINESWASADTNPSRNIELHRETYQIASVFHHPSAESCFSGWLNPENHPHSWFGRGPPISPAGDGQAAFFMSTFDLKEDGSVKMSRPLGVAPPQLSIPAQTGVDDAGEAVELVPRRIQRTAENPWVELRAYANDIHFNHKWTYYNWDRQQYSYADCHMWNSAIKTIYQDEKRHLRKQSEFWTPLSDQHEPNSQPGLYRQYENCAHTGIEELPANQRTHDVNTGLKHLIRDPSGLEASFTTNYATHLYLLGEGGRSHLDQRPATNSRLETHNMYFRFTEQELIDNIMEKDIGLDAGGAAGDIRRHISRRLGPRRQFEYYIDFYKDPWDSNFQTYGHDNAYMRSSGLVESPLPKRVDFSGWPEGHTHRHFIISNSNYMSAPYYLPFDSANGKKSMVLAAQDYLYARPRGPFAEIDSHNNPGHLGPIHAGTTQTLGPLKVINRYYEGHPNEENVMAVHPGPCIPDMEWSFDDLTVEDEVHPDGAPMWGCAAIDESIYDPSNARPIEGAWNERLYFYPVDPGASFRIPPEGTWNRLCTRPDGEGPWVSNGLRQTSQVFADMQIWEQGLENVVRGYADGVNPMPSNIREWSAHRATAFNSMIPIYYRRLVSSPLYPVEREGFPLYENGGAPLSINNLALAYNEHAQLEARYIAGETQSAAANYESVGVEDQKSWLVSKYRAQKHSFSKKFGPLHFFQKNLVKNHYHSPNETRVPVRMLITRIDYMIGNDVEDTRVYFNYDIPETLKGAQVHQPDGETLTPVENEDRRYFLKKGLEKVIYEYLEYSKLERAAMQWPTNGAAAYGNQVAAMYGMPSVSYLADSAFYPAGSVHMTGYRPGHPGGWTYGHTTGLLGSVSEPYTTQFPDQQQVDHIFGPMNNSHHFLGLPRSVYPFKKSAYATHQVPLETTATSGLGYLSHIFNTELIDFEFSSALATGHGELDKQNIQESAYSSTRAENYKELIASMYYCTGFLKQRMFWMVQRDEEQNLSKRMLFYPTDPLFAGSIAESLALDPGTEAGLARNMYGQGALRRLGKMSECHSDPEGSLWPIQLHTFNGWINYEPREGSAYNANPADSLDARFRQLSNFIPYEDYEQMRLRSALASHYPTDLNEGGPAGESYATDRVPQPLVRPPQEVRDSGVLGGGDADGASQWANIRLNPGDPADRLHGEYINASFFYSPLYNRQTGAGSETFRSQNKLSLRNQEKRMKGYVDPLMSFCGHSNLMHYENIRDQTRSAAFNHEKGNYWDNLEANPTDFRKFVDRFKIRRGFATVAKIYSTAAQEEVFYGRQKWFEENGEYQAQTPDWDPGHLSSDLEDNLNRKTAFSWDQAEIDRQFAENPGILLPGGMKMLSDLEVNTEDSYYLEPMTHLSQTYRYTASGSRVKDTDMQVMEGEMRNILANIDPGATREMYLMKKRSDNTPSILSPLHQSGPTQTVVVKDAFLKKAAFEANDNNTNKEVAYKARRIISHLIEHKLRKKDAFGIWARMTCPAFLSGEVPEAKYLRGSQFFHAQSELKYLPAQVVQSLDTITNEDLAVKIRRSHADAHAYGREILRLPTRAASANEPYRSKAWVRNILREATNSTKDLHRWDLWGSHVRDLSQDDNPLNQNSVIPSVRYGMFAERGTGGLLRKRENIMGFRYGDDAYEYAAADLASAKNASHFQNITALNRLITDVSTQLPPELIESFRRLHEVGAAGDHIDRITRLLYGEEGEEPSLSEIKLGLRLVSVLPQSNFETWLADHISANPDNPLVIDRLEEIHINERSLYLDLKNTDEEEVKRVLMHLPIVSRESDYCFGPPDPSLMVGPRLGLGADDPDIWDDDNFNLISTVRQMLDLPALFYKFVTNYNNLRDTKEFKLLTGYAFPSEDMKAAAAIYSAIVTTSMPDMPDLFMPTKNQMMQALNTYAEENKPNEDGSPNRNSGHLSASEWRAFLQTVGTDGIQPPCGGFPSFDAEMLWKKIKELVRYLPASILTSLALILDPGYRSMHDRFRSCSPANKHIRSLDWDAIQYPTELGFAVPVGGPGALVEGTQNGNVPKGGRFANVLWSFPADLAAGMRFVPGLPFVLFNPSFGMAFVKLANYIMGSIGVGAGGSAGASTPCFSADLSADASASLLDGKNGYGHPLLLFGPLALSINQSDKFRLPEDDPEAQRKLCMNLPPRVPGSKAPPINNNQPIGDDCGDDGENDQENE
jgi:hypothetical protein